MHSEVVSFHAADTRTHTGIQKPTVTLSSLESEEEDNDSPMQYPTAVSTVTAAVSGKTSDSTQLQICSKGIITPQQPTPRVRKPTDPAPVRVSVSRQSALSSDSETFSITHNSTPSSPTVGTPAPPHVHQSRSQDTQTPPPMDSQERAITLVTDDTVANVTPKAKRKNARPKASDYPPDIQKLVLAASHHYHIYIWMRNPFPSEDLETRWAVEAWESVTSDGGPTQPLPDQICYVSRHPPPSS